MFLNLTVNDIQEETNRIFQSHSHIFSVPVPQAWTTKLKDKYFTHFTFLRLPLKHNEQYLSGHLFNESYLASDSPTICTTTDSFHINCLLTTLVTCGSLKNKSQINLGPVCFLLHEKCIFKIHALRTFIVSYFFPVEPSATLSRSSSVISSGVLVSRSIVLKWPKLRFVLFRTTTSPSFSCTIGL